MVEMLHSVRYPVFLGVGRLRWTGYVSQSLSRGFFGGVTVCGGPDMYHVRYLGLGEVDQIGIMFAIRFF
jgi:hypothetical protein